jgi:hypothetical protein
MQFLNEAQQVEAADMLRDAIENAGVNIEGLEEDAKGLVLNKCLSVLQDPCVSRFIVGMVVACR